MDLYSIDPVIILMDDYHSSAEAEELIKEGAIVFSADDFVRWLRDACDEEERREFLEDAGLADLDEALEVCRKGQLCIADERYANNIYRGVNDGTTCLPYVIVYGENPM